MYYYTSYYYTPVCLVAIHVEAHAEVQPAIPNGNTADKSVKIVIRKALRNPARIVTSTPNMSRVCRCAATRGT
jgi:hypothetical protein